MKLSMLIRTGQVDPLGLWPQQVMDGDYDAPYNPSAHRGLRWGLENAAGQDGYRLWIDTTGSSRGPVLQSLQDCLGPWVYWWLVTRQDQGIESYESSQPWRWFDTAETATTPAQDMLPGWLAEAMALDPSAQDGLLAFVAQRAWECIMYNKAQMAEVRFQRRIQRAIVEANAPGGEWTWLRDGVAAGVLHQIGEDMA